MRIKTKELVIFKKENNKYVLPDKTNSKIERDLLLLIGQTVSLLEIRQ